MPAKDKERWKQDLRNAAGHVEDDLQWVIAYINDKVVPEVRKNGSQALRAAGLELQKLAQRMDDRRAAAEKTAPPEEKF